MDVVVFGEPLLELSSSLPLADAVDFRLSFSGDALNAAGAAAAAGASTALIAHVGNDELSARLVQRVAELGVDTAAVRRTSGPTGAYFVGADPDGTREFAYVRSGSAATMVTEDDLSLELLGSARCLLVSGITAALSPSCERAVLRAVEVVVAAGGVALYDPNYRRRLVEVADARRHLESVAALGALLVPSCPADTSALLGTDDPRLAGRRCLELGAGAVAVTTGPGGVWLFEGADAPVHVPAAPASVVVDATGAGDVFAGTLAARLAAGDDLLAAARLGAAAAALSLAGQGGTGRLAPLAETRELAGRA